MNNDNSNWNTFRTLIPGTVGAIFNNYAAYPFDTLRVRLQDARKVELERKSTNIRSSIRQMFRYGILGGTQLLFRGSSASALGMIAENSVVFSGNRILKDKLYGLNNHENRLGQSPLTFSQEMTVGFLSGSLSTIVACPFETIKSNLQAERQRHTKTKLNSFTIYRSLGISGLYRGFIPSYFRNVPFYMLFFPLYSQYGDLASRYSGRPYSDLGMGYQALAGGLTGATSWALTYPLDSIKCNQQIQPPDADARIRTILKNIYRVEGSVPKTILRLYRGVGLTMIRAFPAAGSLMVGVELANSFLY